MIQSTSSEAYAQLKDVGRRQREVYAVLQGGPMNNRQIGVALGLGSGSITSRVFELRRAGLVEEAYRAIDEKPQGTGVRVIFWKTVERQPEDIVGKQFARLRESFGDKGDQTLFSFAI